MSYNSIWIFLLILEAFVTSSPIQDRYDLSVIGIDGNTRNTSPEIPKYENTPEPGDEQVISVRITSSVAVGRGKDKLPIHKYEPKDSPLKYPVQPVESTTQFSVRVDDTTTELSSDLPPNLIGANIEYIKQLNSKKGSRDHTAESVHPFQLMVHSQHPNDNESPLNENPTKIDDYDENIPTARKVPLRSEVNQLHEHKENRGYHHSDITIPVDFYEQNNGTNDQLFTPSEKFGLKINVDSNKSETNKTNLQVHQHSDKKGTRDINQFVSSNDNYPTDDSIAESSIKSVEFTKTTATVPPSSYITNLSSRPLNDDRNTPRLTTVSFNIVHDGTESTNNNERSESYISQRQAVSNQQYYDSSKIYSQPAKVYSEPSKFYSEPAKIYSEPAKIYSEPAKIYSEPAKIYSEPAKFYSEPASLHLHHNAPSAPASIPPIQYTPWQQPPRGIESTSINTTPVSAITQTYQGVSTPVEHQPERNYEVDENVSVLTDGKSHGVQDSSTEKCKQDNCKVGYVVEGRQYKKYRVEERTADGFIVGEYGVVRNEDGALRGVRYTADSDASPRLIHDALMKFLQLK